MLNRTKLERGLQRGRACRRGWGNGKGGGRGLECCPFSLGRPGRSRARLRLACRRAGPLAKRTGWREARAEVKGTTCEKDWYVLEY